MINETIIGTGSGHHGDLNDITGSDEHLGIDSQIQASNTVDNHHSDNHHDERDEHQEINKTKNERRQTTMKSNLNSTLTGITIFFALIIGLAVDIDAKPIESEISRINNISILKLNDGRIVTNIDISRVTPKDNIVINRIEQISPDGTPQIEIARITPIIETIDINDSTISRNLEAVRISERIDEVNSINRMIDTNLIS